nr:MAG TPA: hypothetical protein [Caudoviricetes sp.]
MSIANITIMFCKNQEKLVEKYKKGGGELEKERKILIEEIEKLLKSLTYEQLRSVYIFTLQKIK